MVEKTLSSERIYEGKVVNLRVDTVEKDDGSQTAREIVEHAECVVVVVLDEADNALMVKQYRKAVEKALLEIPAGGIEPGEQPVEAVNRELQEETGFLARKVQKLGGFYSSPGYSNEYLYFYVASQLEHSQLQGEDTAEIEVVKVPMSQVQNLIANGEIVDAKSIAGLLRVQTLGLSGRSSEQPSRK